MTGLLFPNKERPTSYRVLDKGLGIQEYFPFKRHGGRAKALGAANARQIEIDQIKR